MFFQPTLEAAKCHMDLKSMKFIDFLDISLIVLSLIIPRSMIDCCGLEQQKKSRDNEATDNTDKFDILFSIGF